jgi:hypothetical protein
MALLREPDLREGRPRGQPRGPALAVRGQTRAVGSTQPARAVPEAVAAAAPGLGILPLLPVWQAPPPVQR